MGIPKSLKATNLLKKCRIRRQNPLKEAFKRHSPFEVNETQCTVSKAWLGSSKKKIRNTIGEKAV